MPVVLRRRYALLCGVSVCFHKCFRSVHISVLQNERDPKLKERTHTRNSILDQYGKVLPRVQRKLATERSKPYHHPATILREGTGSHPTSSFSLTTLYTHFRCSTDKNMLDLDVGGTSVRIQPSCELEQVCLSQRSILWNQL